MIDPQVFPFVTAKLHRLEVLRFEEGSPIPQRNDIQTVLFIRGRVQKNGAGGSVFLVEFELFWF